jgi:hypothetical protein
VEVAQHAIDRFRQRTGAKYSDEKIKNKLIKMHSKGEKVSLTAYRKVMALLNHGFREASYVEYCGWILVVVDSVIITIHNNEAKLTDKK